MDFCMKNFLKFSAEYKFGHIPSALSQISYLQYLLPKIKKDFEIVIGKPFGAQAYYYIWNRMGYIDDVSKLSYGVKDNELDFVSYSEETLGNAVGVALGKALSNKSNKPIWCNISDGALLMGPTMEAFANYQKIASSMKRPLLITIDFNKSLAKSTSHLNAYELKEWLHNLGWNADVTSSDYNDHPRFINSLFDQALELLNDGKIKVLVLIIRTIKGQGVEELEQLSHQLHYDIMTEEEVEKLTIKSYKVYE